MKSRYFLLFLLAALFSLSLGAIAGDKKGEGGNGSGGGHASSEPPPRPQKPGN